MRISEAFPGQYLKAADLKGKSAVVTIDKVSMEDIGGDHKPVVYFKGTERGLVLNKTNANNIVFVYGDDTDGWLGKAIELFPTLVDFQGRSVDAIRVRPPANPIDKNDGAPVDTTRPATGHQMDEPPF